MTAPTLVAQGSTVVGTAAVTPNVHPTGSRPGDLVILAIQSANEAVTVPTGWSQCPGSPQGVGTAATAGSTRLTLLYAMVPNDTGSSVNGQIADTGNHTMATAYVFRGVDPDDPFNAHGEGTEANNDTSLSATGLTTTVDDCLVACFVADSFDGAPTLSGIANADLSGVTQSTGPNGTHTASGTGGGYEMIYGTKAVAGSVGATTATYDQNANYAYVTLALRPDRGFPKVTAIGTAGGTTTSRTIPWPTHASGDIGFLFQEAPGGATLATPSGWTNITNSPQATGAGAAGTQLHVSWHRATSSSETDPTITGGATDHVSGVIIVVSGAAGSGDCIDTSAGNVKASTSTATTAPTITTSTDYTMVVYAVARDDDSSALHWGSTTAFTDAAATGITSYRSGPGLLYDFGILTGNGGGWGIFIGWIKTAGTAGALSATSSISVIEAMLTFAIKTGTSSGFPRFYATIIG